MIIWTIILTLLGLGVFTSNIIHKRDSKHCSKDILALPLHDPYDDSILEVPTSYVSTKLPNGTEVVVRVNERNEKDVQLIGIKKSTFTPGHRYNIRRKDTTFNNMSQTDDSADPNNYNIQLQDWFIRLFTNNAKT